MRYVGRTLTIVLACTVAVAKAQQWCPPGAEWGHGHHSVDWTTGETHVGTVLARYVGDEEIGVMSPIGSNRSCSMRSWVRGNSTVSRGARRIPGPTKVWSGRGIP